MKHFTQTSFQHRFTPIPSTSKPNAEFSLAILLVSFWLIQNCFTMKIKHQKVSTFSSITMSQFKVQKCASLMKTRKSLIMLWPRIALCFWSIDADRANIEGFSFEKINKSRKIRKNKKFTFFAKNLTKFFYFYFSLFIRYKNQIWWAKIFQ